MGKDNLKASEAKKISEEKFQQFSISRPTDEKLDPELRFHLKLLGKRDTVTKTKALENISNILSTRLILASRNQMDPIEVSLFLPVWLKLFGELCTHNSPRIREMCLNPLIEILSHKKTAKLMRKKHWVFVLPRWFLLQFDSHGSVRKSAASKFQQVIRLSQKPKLISAYIEDILHFMIETIGSTPDSLYSLRKESESDMLLRHERMISSAFKAITNILRFCVHHPMISETVQILSTIENNLPFVTLHKVIAFENPTITASLLGLVIEINKETLDFQLINLSRLCEKNPVVHFLFTTKMQANLTVKWKALASYTLRNQTFFTPTKVETLLSPMLQAEGHLAEIIAVFYTALPIIVENSGVSQSLRDSFLNVVQAHELSEESQQIYFEIFMYFSDRLIKSEKQHVNAFVEEWLITPIQNILSQSYTKSAPIGNFVLLGKVLVATNCYHPSSQTLVSIERILHQLLESTVIEDLYICKTLVQQVLPLLSNEMIESILQVSKAVTSIPMLKGDFLNVTAEICTMCIDIASSKTVEFEYFSKLAISVIPISSSCAELLASLLWRNEKLLEYPPIQTFFFGTLVNADPSDFRTFCNSFAVKIDSQHQAVYCMFFDVMLAHIERNILEYRGFSLKELHVFFEIFQHHLHLRQSDRFIKKSLQHFSDIYTDLVIVPQTGQFFDVYFSVWMLSVIPLDILSNEYPEIFFVLYLFQHMDSKGTPVCLEYFLIDWAVNERVCIGSISCGIWNQLVEDRGVLPCIMNVSQKCKISCAMQFKLWEECVLLLRSALNPTTVCLVELFVEPDHTFIQLLESCDHDTLFQLYQKMYFLWNHSLQVSDPKFDVDSLAHMLVFYVCCTNLVRYTTQMSVDSDLMYSIYSKLPYEIIYSASSYSWKLSLLYGHKYIFCFRQICRHLPDSDLHALCTNYLLESGLSTTSRKWHVLELLHCFKAVVPASGFEENDDAKHFSRDFGIIQHIGDIAFPTKLKHAFDENEYESSGIDLIISITLIHRWVLSTDDLDVIQSFFSEMIFLVERTFSYFSGTHGHELTTLDLMHRAMELLVLLSQVLRHETACIEEISRVFFLCCSSTNIDILCGSVFQPSFGELTVFVSNTRVSDLILFVGSRKLLEEIIFRNIGSIIHHVSLCFFRICFKILNSDSDSWEFLFSLLEDCYTQANGNGCSTHTRKNLLAWLLFTSASETANFDSKQVSLDWLNSAGMDFFRHMLNDIYENCISVVRSSDLIDLNRMEEDLTIDKVIPSKEHMVHSGMFPQLAIPLFQNILYTFPHASRLWWCSQTRSVSSNISKKVCEHFTSNVVDRVVSAVQLAYKNNPIDLTIQCNRTLRLITAEKNDGDIRLRLVIQFPANFPLEPPVVEMDKSSVGAKPAQVRRWILNIKCMISSGIFDGSLYLALNALFATVSSIRPQSPSLIPHARPVNIK